MNDTEHHYDFYLMSWRKTKSHFTILGTKSQLKFCSLTKPLMYSFLEKNGHLYFHENKREISIFIYAEYMYIYIHIHLCVYIDVCIQIYL